MRRKSILLLAVAFTLAVAIAVVWLVRNSGETAIQLPATTSSTAPTTASMSSAAGNDAQDEQGPPSRYSEVVRAAYPKLPTTQPLAFPLSIDQAAHIVLSDPVYLSPRGDLWITRPDAEPTEAVLKKAVELQGEQLTLTVQDDVAYVHWHPRPDGPWTFEVVARTPGGKQEVVTLDGRKPLPAEHAYLWDSAREYNEHVIVPTRTGVSVFQFSPEVKEAHYEFATPAPESELSGDYSEPQVLFDWAGFLAWMPWDEGKTGSRGAVRYVDGEWTPLGPDQGWPERLLQLLPLSDGSVLQIVANEDGTASLAVSTLEKLDLDEQEIELIVADLSHQEEDKREQAFKKLAGYGPGVWPVLEKLIDDEPPEAQARLRELMKNRVLPTLGGMTLLGAEGRYLLTTVTRHDEGGAVYFAEAGVLIPTTEADTPAFRTPAWLDVRPGPWVDLLSEAMVADLDPRQAQLKSTNGEWIVSSDVRGPRRFVGNGFVPLLRPEEAAFSELIGIDHRGRWLFRKPSDGDSPATGPAPTTGAAAPQQTLVIDPTLPDPSPRLPVWVYSTSAVVGWDKDNWPAVKRGGSWVLKESNWEPLDEKEKLLTTREEIPPPKSIDSATQPSTSPTTTEGSTRPAIATQPTTVPAELGEPILVAEDGTRYYDGKTRLHVTKPDGEQVVWDLPPIATGSGEVHLIQTADGLLFLFNQPGRVLRIRPTPDSTTGEPFELEATFAKRIPSVPEITRVWLDPAGRIIMAYGNQLAILFPQGYIPAPIQKMMPAEQLELEP